MIPETTREALLEAMERFDRELRDSPEWANWEQKESHKYAIEQNGERYPVKKVVSVATNTPVGSFSGGDEANSYVKKLGFPIVALRESEQAETSIQFLLEQILTEYLPARAGGGFGKSHPIWQAFIRLKNAIEGLPALRDRRTLRVDWSIGKGNWAGVPWLAIIDSKEAEAPRKGIYCVFLFREDMAGVYATLNQGVEKPKQELRSAGARSFLKESASQIRAKVPFLQESGFQLDEKIDLRSDGLRADYYEDSTIAYKLYETGSVPADDQISSDLQSLLTAYAIALEATSLPQSGSAKTQESTWIFQANPKFFDLPAALSERSELTWLVKQHSDRIHIGDTVYLWESGPGGGIVAVASVKTEPATLPEDEATKNYVRDAGKFEGDQLRVWLTIKKVLIDQVPRIEILNHPVLRYLTILAGPQGTNFLLTSEQAEALGALVDGLEPEHQSEFDRTSAVQELVQAIEAAGFIFEPWQVAAYVTALRTKPFVILAGVTGTGKSRLPALVAQLTGGQCDLIPVRPDWTDSADVLGYVDLQGALRPGRLLQIAQRAQAQSNQHWTFIIDEMNLARVEQYLAEVLSRIEDRRSSPTGGFASRPLLAMQLRMEDRGWSEIGLPPNLGIVGTVNMDETTHGFSRKVLDRAFTIELSDTDLTRWTAATSQPTTASWPAAAWHPRATSLSGLTGLNQEDTERIQKVIGVLTNINGYLQQAQLQVGYRTRDEVALFVLHASEVTSGFLTRDGTAVDPLDLAIHMKILPRLVGGSGAVRRAVLQLLGWSAYGKPFVSDDDAQAVLDEWIDLGRPGALPESLYPRTAGRLCIMWERLLSEGYTSYWL